MASPPPLETSASIEATQPVTTRGSDAGQLAPTPGPVILGVASGLSGRFGVSVAVVRAIFTTLAAAGGVGVLLYLAIWLLWRNRPPTNRPPSGFRDLGAVIFAGGLVWQIGFSWSGVRPMLVLPVGLVTMGVALGWRTTSPANDRGISADSSTRTGYANQGRARSLILRMTGGVVLCIGGLAAFMGQSVDLATLRDSFLGLLVAFAGVGLVVGPSLIRLFRSVSVERDERVRAEERALVAAHLHDSVLQTLTLIQKRSDDPPTVASLARHQERSLRRWLYGTRSPYETASGVGALGWREMFEEMVGSVEDNYATAIELVMVGEGEIGDPSVSDAGLPPRRPDDNYKLAAIVAAAREGLINASKFSGETNLSVYCELTRDRFDVFVRDRGRGFDLTAVSPDRRGVRDSIISRLVDVGGSAVVRTAPGAGTEVALSIPVSSRSASDFELEDGTEPASSGRNPIA